MVRPSVTVPPTLPTAARPEAPGVAHPAHVEEQLVVGEAYEKAVANLMEMGFPREQVIKAMKAAFNNPERAADYLLTVRYSFNNLKGIPDIPADMPMPGPGARVPPMPGRPPAFIPRPPAPVARPEAPVAPAEGAEGAEEGEEGEMGGMGALGGAGDIQQIRERLLQNPGYLQQLMQELQAANPQLYQAVQQNPQLLLQLLMGAGGAGGAGPRRPPHGGIQVTPEEKAAIDRV